MHIEYSRKGDDGYSYAFNSWERSTIAKALKPLIPKLEKKIERIRNNPKNEGQASYQNAIDEIIGDIRSIKEIIKTFEE